MLDHMNHPDDTNTLNLVGSRIKAETLRHIEGGETSEAVGAVAPFTHEEFHAACDHLGKDILSKRKIESLLKELRDDYMNLKQKFPPDKDYALVVFPTSDMGNSLSPEAITEDQYLHLLSLDKKTGLAANFSWNPGRYFDLLPKDLQKFCRLSVQYTDDASVISTADFARLYNSYIDVFNNLREYLGLERFHDIDRYPENTATVPVRGKD